jgi:hypothetical protein|tara:strand:+ start:2747 stop:3295 length:549 start_codon:yes stop_codon:yes gene_type:complete
MVGVDKLKYKIIRNFLNKTEIGLLKEYCKIRHFDNAKNFDTIQNNCGDTAFYKDPLIQTILYKKRPLIEKEVNIKLYETYTYWRCYTYGAELKKHKDRPSCEISSTVFIDSDKNDWGIFMGGEEIMLNKGDAVIYNGCNIEHWREPFDGDYHIQAFLHYVDKNGKYANFKGDPSNQWNVVHE